MSFCIAVLDLMHRFFSHAKEFRTSPSSPSSQLEGFIRRVCALTWRPGRTICRWFAETKCGHSGNQWRGGKTSGGSDQEHPRNRTPLQRKQGETLKPSGKRDHPTRGTSASFQGRYVTHRSKTLCGCMGGASPSPTSLHWQCKLSQDFSLLTWLACRPPSAPPFWSTACSTSTSSSVERSSTACSPVSSQRHVGIVVGIGQAVGTGAQGEPVRGGQGP